MIGYTQIPRQALSFLLILQPLIIQLAARMEDRVCWRSRTAVSAAYQSVLIALAAADDAVLLLDEDLAAAAAAGAGDEADTAAGVADEGRVLARGAVEEPPELTGLVQMPHLFSAADEAAAD